MKYRKFGKSGFMVSALSFGCMRLPCDENGNVKDDEAIEMMRHAIDNGINYLDSAYVYHGGYSEVVTGKALKNGYRNKIKIATKLPVWSVTVPDDFDRLLDEQLTRLQVETIDYYLLHSLGGESWEKVKRLDLMEKSEKAVKAGKINHIGFSFHGGNNEFKKIIDEYDKWEFCQVQYNYMDIENQAGTDGVKYAHAKGVPVIVMEPLLGGRLSNPPENIRNKWKEYKTVKSPVYWALKWVWNHPEVTTVLSGMSSMKQLEENLIIADESDKPLSSEDLGLIGNVREMYKAQFPIPCTKCGYCMPCTVGITIPRILELYNDGVSHNDISGAQYGYRMFVQDAGKADKCTVCKACEEKCPQKIDISGWMGKIHKALG